MRTPGVHQTSRRSPSTKKAGLEPSVVGSEPARGGGLIYLKITHHAHLPLRQADGSHRGQRDSGRPGVPGARDEPHSQQGIATIEQTPRDYIQGIDNPDARRQINDAVRTIEQHFGRSGPAGEKMGNIRAMGDALFRPRKHLLYGGVDRV